MAKRRNKNKKAGPVTIIKAADLNPQPVEELAASEPETVEETSAAAVADEGTDGAQTQAQAQFELSESEAEALAEAMSGVPESAGAADEPIESAEPAVAQEVPEPVESALPVDTADPDEPQPEFADASALLAQSVPVEEHDGGETHPFESVPVESDAFGSVPVESMQSADDSSAAGSTPDVAPSAPPPSAQPSAGSGRNRKDRKLKLNKLQKHARSDLEPLAVPQPEPDPVVAETPAEADREPEPGRVAAEAPAEPEPVRQGPSEPRIAAFAKLSEYQTLSLAHVVGVPEEADLPGHWRGVGFAISGRRLVTAFDEVVEIIRVPQITHVPGTQAWMLGVANVRGTLLPVVDLKQFLEGERTVMYEGQRVMVVRQSGGNVAVLIDQLYGQRAFNDSQKVDVAADGTTRYGHFIKQLYRVGDNDWGVFSMSMLTRTPEFRQAAA